MDKDKQQLENEQLQDKQIGGVAEQGASANKPNTTESVFGSGKDINQPDADASGSQQSDQTAYRSGS